MEEINILFAMSTNSSTQIEEKILSYYEKVYSKKFTFTKEYYLQGVVKALKESHYDIVIINEILENEPIQPQFIDMLTDNYDNLRVILVINDRHRGETLAKKLYAMGCYDCIFKSEFSLTMVADMIEHPRKKKDAKEYYNLDDSLENLEEAVNNTGLSEIPQDELEHSLDTFNSATEEDIEELFDLAEQTYTFPQMVFLISTLNEKVINLMKDSGCDVLKYKKALDRETKKVAVNEKVKIVERVVERVVEKKVVVPSKPIREIVEKEVVREVYKTPEDYKKVIAIVGSSRNVGATTIVDMLSEIYSKEDKKVGIIDFTTNKDLFERHIFNSDEKWEPLQQLLKGVDNPYKINKKCSLYTSSLNSECKLEPSEYIKIMDIVKMQNDIVIVDIELKDLFDIYSMIDKAFIVVSQELTNTKEFTNNVSINEDILKNDKKIQFIINKHINDKDMPSDKELIECYLYKIYNYLDTSTNSKIMDNKFPILKINFDVSILMNSYKGIYTKLAKEEDQLYEICNSCYPLSKREEISKLSLARFLKKMGILK